jgi:hydrogenase expression/formation protein HypC
MCLAIPMQITSIDGLMARCEAKGTTRDVSLLMLQDDPPQVGDYIKVSLGLALHTVSEEEARQAWELFDQILCELGEAGPPPS